VSASASTTCLPSRLPARIIFGLPATASFASKSAALHIQAVRDSDTSIPEPGVFYCALLVTEIHISQSIPLQAAKKEDSV
jgi:hypothetical protein